ncbi:MAG: mechanosensitive ion channel [Bacteroidales bacterium]|nr:mechanosensitive ion channel [Bacteroidales bacterium]MCB8999754.1 mechanosensitive ion channel [Bacteroidales bacterium]MCB9013436.1 mechanosensitive ion channel [Bacteroidales bacterium]
MNKVAELFQETLGLAPETQSKIIYSLVIIVVLGLVRFSILKLVWNFTVEPKTRYTWKRSTSFVIGFISILLILGVWISAIRNFGAFLGLLTAGVAIALKDPLTNIAGWIFILVRTPFSLGDRIQIGEHSGDVIDIRLFQFSLLEIGNWVNADQSTGRIIHIPNGKVFTEPQANYSAGFQFIWNEMKVLLTFESNWKKAKDLLQKLIIEYAGATSESAEKKMQDASKKYMIFYQYLTPIVYTKVEDSGVLLTLRYICDPRKRRSSENDIWEKVLDLFEANNDMEFAYPTLRYYKQGEDAQNS